MPRCAIWLAWTIRISRSSEAISSLVKGGVDTLLISFPSRQEAGDETAKISFRHRQFRDIRFDGGVLGVEATGKSSDPFTVQPARMRHSIQDISSWQHAHFHQMLQSDRRFWAEGKPKGGRKSGDLFSEIGFNHPAKQRSFRRRSVEVFAIHENRVAQ